MTKNIRERIKERSENKIQNGGIKIIQKDTEQKKKELKAGMALAWKVFKIYLQELINYIHFKLRPLFNLYLNWGEVFEQNSISSSDVRDKLKTEIREKEIEINNLEKQKIKEITELVKSGKSKEINVKKTKYEEELDIKKKKLEKKKKELSDIKDKQYISIFGYFAGFIKSFTEKSEEEKTPQEKIMEKRSKKYGNVPKPSLGIFKKFFKPIIIVGIITASILSNFMVQKRFIGDLLEKKTSICSAIFQSQVYKDIAFNTPYSYFFNKSKNKYEYLYMRDFYAPCSYKTYLSCGYESIPTLTTIMPIINAGARVLHFDVFEDVLPGKSKTSFSPMVRCATNKVSQGIHFDDVIKEIKIYDPFSYNSAVPFILYLDMWYQDSNEISTNIVNIGFRYTETYDMIYNSINFYFGDGNSNVFPEGEDNLISEEDHLEKDITTKAAMKINNLKLPNIKGYGYGGAASSNSSLAYIPMNMAKNKLLLISNINPQMNYGSIEQNSPKGTGNASSSTLAQYLYASVSYPTVKGNIFNGLLIKNRNPSVLKGMQGAPGIAGMIYKNEFKNMSGLAGHSGAFIPELEQFTSENIMIAIPEVEKQDSKLIWKSNLQNPIFLDCFQYGIQFVFMNYQACFKETNNYIQFFQTNKGPFVPKRENLRYISYSFGQKQTQNTNASYAERKGATIDNGQGEPFFKSFY